MPRPPCAHHLRVSLIFGRRVEDGLFDFRAAVEARLKVPVVYSNDGNAASLYAHVNDKEELAAITAEQNAKKVPTGGTATWPR